MSPTDSNILSISFSRNRLGYAVFERGHLDYYGGKSLRQLRSRSTPDRRLISILDAFVFAHNVSKLVFPILNKQQRQSSDLRSLHRTVERYCRRKGLAMLIQDPLQVRRSICGVEKPIKATAVRNLIEIYPELMRYASSSSEWERRYYGHLFTSIGSGLVALGLVLKGIKTKAEVE